MSLLPYLVNDLLDEVRRPPVDLFDQHFGLGLDDFSIPDLLPSRRSLSVPALRAGYYRPWRLLSQEDSGASKIKSDDKEFSVVLDVNHFKPEELKVKLDEDGFVVVEGEHEERSDEHGFISRHFKRRYKLPEDVQQDTLKSKLSSDGVLSLTAAKQPRKRKAADREIEIVRTNQPALKNVDTEQIHENAVEAKKKRTEKKGSR